jgi:hypothetical protein
MAAALSKAWTVVGHSNSGIVGSNPTWGMDVCVRLFYVCAVLCEGKGLATAWSPSKVSYKLCKKIKKLKKRPRPNKGPQTDNLACWLLYVTMNYKVWTFRNRFWLQSVWNWYAAATSEMYTLLYIKYSKFKAVPVLKARPSRLIPVLNQVLRHENARARSGTAPRIPNHGTEVGGWVVTFLFRSIYPRRKSSRSSVALPRVEPLISQAWNNNADHSTDSFGFKRRFLLCPLITFSISKYILDTATNLRNLQRSEKFLTAWEIICFWGTVLFDGVKFCLHR